MYIKADYKNLKENNAKNATSTSHRSSKEIGEEIDVKIKGLPYVITPGSIKNGLEKYHLENRKYNVLNGVSNISSLNFLHKPQRVTNLNAGRFPEEELQRNTDLNKKLTGINVLPELSRSSVIEERNLELTNYFINNTSNESILIPFPAPVYKKSGELVKSSLKKRSQSLPATPSVKKPEDDDYERDKSLMLVRSKSVHFDQTTPVKYFSKDESPINVNATDEHSNILNFIHKPVQLLDEHWGEDDIIPAGPGSYSLSSNGRLLNGGDLSKIEPKKLRKSKRFQEILGKENKENIENNALDDNETDTGTDNSSKRVISTTSNIISKPATRILSIDKASVTDITEKNPETCNKQNFYHVQKVVGLYNENFPILSNKNPKSLKLNIFINLSRGKKCFLQELTLHIQNRQNLSNGTTQSEPHNTVARYILGKVLVKNIYYDKRVIVRYTWNAWKTANEVEGIWLSNSECILPGTNMDIFHFLIDDNCREDVIGKLEFCIHYTTRDDHVREEVWDNNDGDNYKIDVVLKGFNNPFGL